MNYPVAVIPRYLIVQAKHYNEPALQRKILFIQYPKHKLKGVPKNTFEYKEKKVKEWPRRNAGAHFWYPYNWEA